MRHQSLCMSGIGLLAILGLAGFAGSSRAGQAQAVFSVEDFGAIGDGRADDTRAIQRVLDLAKSRGGGTVALEAGKTYRLSRHAPGDQGPSLRLGAGVSLDGQGATLLQSGNASFLGADFRTTVEKKITADVAAGANELRLESCEGLRVGDRIFSRIGQNAWDSREPRQTLLATITAIRGDTIVLDQRIPEAVSISVSNPANRVVRKVTSMWCDGTIRNVQLRTVAGVATEEGINLVAAQNVTVEGITSHDHVGAGLLVGQFCEGVTARKLECRSNPNPSGQGSFGRLMGWSNCTNVRVSDFHASSLGGAAIFFIESYSHDIEFENFTINDDKPRPDKAIFACVVQGASLSMKNYVFRSVNAFAESDHGGTPATLAIGDAAYDCTQLPFVMSANEHYGRLDVTIAGHRTIYDFAHQQEGTLTFTLRPGLHEAFRSPAGILTELAVLSPSDWRKNSASLYLGRWGVDGEQSNGRDIASTLVPGKWVEIQAPLMLGTVTGVLYASKSLRQGGALLQVNCSPNQIEDTGWISAHWKCAPVISD
jgi:hypothetical protein